MVGPVQITTSSPQAGENLEVVQAMLLKKTLQAEGKQQMRLIESTDVGADAGEEPPPRVGRYLDVKV